MYRLFGAGGLSDITPTFAVAGKPPMIAETALKTNKLPSPGPDPSMMGSSFEHADVNPAQTPITYSMTTLGCRVNHAETRELESVLLDRGFAPAPIGHAPDLGVVHTCSVTATAARKSRHAARRMARASTGPILVTGCFVGTDPEQAALIAESTQGAAVPHHTDNGSTLIERFAQQIDAWIAARAEGGRHATVPIRVSEPASSGNRITSLPLTRCLQPPARHTRAELKIQDGCDAHCTFCIIPSIRKTLRSKTILDAVVEARRLVDLGHQEVVLTGVFIGAYGHETALRKRQEFPAREPLADLLDAVAAVPGLMRLRISSMEPGDITAPLLDAMVANAPTIVPHLHLPLQSGSDPILHRMNRQYRVGAYLDMIDQVNEALTTPDGLPPAITTDIICGFPGETEADFEETIKLARQVGYLHMHVFPFSPRKGTAAARWKDQFVPHPVSKARVRRLIDLEDDPDDGLSITYRRRLMGRTIRVMIEQHDSDDPEIATGRCDHYALIRVKTEAARGSLVHVLVTHVTPADTIGRLVDQSVPLTVLA